MLKSQHKTVSITVSTVLSGHSSATEALQEASSSLQQVQT